MTICFSELASENHPISDGLMLESQPFGSELVSKEHRSTLFYLHNQHNTKQTVP